MNQEFFTNLPSGIIINILSRLPVRTIISCKCVCKSWLNLLQTYEFAKSHLSKSVPGLAVYQNEMSSELLKICEFDDALDLEHHELHYSPIAKFDLREFIIHPHPSIAIQGSANGLLFLRGNNTHPNVLYICYPIRFEYIELPGPEKNVWYYPSTVTYGFGVSKITGQHKAVRIFNECTCNPDTSKLLGIPFSECQVYTLGKGSWRNFSPGENFEYNCRSIGAFLNGNLHWLVSDLKGSWWISCFDLEAELFSTFSPPPSLQRRERCLWGLVDLGGCLCLCDNSSDDEIVIWLMREYGIEKSWTREFVISKIPGCAGECYEVVYPLKVSKDGDILMSWEDFHLFYYSNKTKTISGIEMLDLQTYGFDSSYSKLSFTQKFCNGECTLILIFLHIKNPVRVFCRLCKPVSVHLNICFCLSQ